MTRGDCLLLFCVLVASVVVVIFKLENRLFAACCSMGIETN